MYEGKSRGGRWRRSGSSLVPGDELLIHSSSPVESLGMIEASLAARLLKSASLQLRGWKVLN